MKVSERIKNSYSLHLTFKQAISPQRIKHNPKSEKPQTMSAQSQHKHLNTVFLYFPHSFIINIFLIFFYIFRILSLLTFLWQSSLHVSDRLGAARN